VNQYFAISREKQRCLADAINLLGVVLIRRRAVGLFSFILRTHLAYDVSINLEAGKHSASLPMTSYIPAARQVAVRGLSYAHISVCNDSSG